MKLRCLFTSWFGVCRPISLDVLDQFSQSFHHIKVLYMPMMDLYLILQFVKRRCLDSKEFCCNDGKLTLRAFFAVRQYSICFATTCLGGDTVAPSGLLARLCHAFLVFNLF